MTNGFADQKRAFTLAIRAVKLLAAHRPYIAMLAEHNVRRDSSRRTSSPP
jgi:hypothetical protein